MNEELKVTITAEIGDLQSNINEAKEAVNEFSSETENANSQSNSAFSGMSAAAMAQFAIIENAISSAISKVQEFINDAMTVGDTIDKQSQMMQMSAQSYQEWSYVLQRNGTDISSLKKGIKEITGDLGDMAQGVEVDTSAYDALGVSLKNSDGTMRTTEEVLKDTILSLASMDDVTQRNALAQDIFGNSYANLLPLLNSGADSIEELIGVADEYAVISDADVKASADLADAQLTMKSALQGAGSALAGTLMPALTKVGYVLADIFKWMSEHKTLMTVIIAIVGGLAAAFAAYHIIMTTTKAITTAVTIAQELFNGAMAANPIGIVVIAIGALIAAIVLLITHWDEVKETVVKVWNTMKETISKVIDAVKGFIDKLVQDIKEKFDKIKEAITEKINYVKEFLTNIFEAIKSVVSEKINNMLSVITTVFNSIKEAIRTAITAAKDVISNIFGAIQTFVSEKINSIKSNVSNVFNSIKDTISNVLNNAKTIVTNIFSGIYDAITTKINNAKQKVSDAIEKIKSFFKFEWKLPSLKLPHISIKGSFSLSPPSVPHFAIDWYAQGGVFEVPTLFAHNGKLGGLGENGAEAIVPLEKNTEWLTRIASMLNERMGGQQIVLTVNDKVFAETAITSINNLTRQTGNLGLVIA